MTGTPGFTVDVDQNSYLPAGASQVDAIVTVTMTGGPLPPAGLEMIIVDCSTSMSGDKIVSARRATAAAIAELRDGVSFTVIAGTDRAEQLYPQFAGTATADAGTRAEATTRVERLEANGPTGIGAWLTLAGQIAELARDTLRHDFRSIDPARARILLVEATDQTVRLYEELELDGDLAAAQYG